MIHSNVPMNSYVALDETAARFRYNAEIRIKWRGTHFVVLSTLGNIEGIATNMAPPRPIEGTIGSKIRVILGDDGHEWLLLLDHDDGNQKWQSKNWKSIPSGLAKQINNCTAKGRDVKGVDFGPNFSWYVHGVKPDGSGGHAWWGGLDAAKSNAIKEATSKSIPSKVALGSQNSCPSLCLISGNNGYHCINTSDGLSKRLKLIHSRGKDVKMVRLFTDGQYYIEDDQGTEW